MWHFLFDSSSRPLGSHEQTGASLSSGNIKVVATLTQNIARAGWSNIHKHPPPLRPHPSLLNLHPPAPTLLSSNNQLSIYHLSLFDVTPSLARSQQCRNGRRDNFLFFVIPPAWQLGRFWRRSVEGKVVQLYTNCPKLCLSNVCHQLFFFAFNYHHLSYVCISSDPTLLVFAPPHLYLKAKIYVECEPYPEDLTAFLDILSLLFVAIFKELANSTLLSLSRGFKSGKNDQRKPNPWWKPSYCQISFT